MKKHYFNDVQGKYRSAYRDYYICHNLESARTGSVIFLLLNVVIRVLYFVFPLSLTRAENFPEFDITNWVFIGSGAVFYLLSNLLIEEYKRAKKATAIMALFVFIFSLYIIGCGIFSSFIATADPRNALVLYLIALIVVSVMFVFEYYETIILIVATEIFFTALLIYTNADDTGMIYSQLSSLIMLAGFYLISRYFYSYKANYYLQVNEIRVKTAEIEHASEFKSQLLGIVAHDLRNPIAAVESLAMIMEMDDIDIETQENLNLMKKSCIQARTIIDDLLESARNENATEFKTIKTDLNKLLTETVETWKMQKGNRHIEFISRATSAYTQLNKEKFQRVLDNLVGNALKFSRENSMVEVILIRKDPYIIIEVKDTGIGIPANKLSIIFDPFSKAGRTGLKGEQSTGLGLSIVKQIVEKHKGKIEVESEEGKGSTFRILLPVDSSF